MNIDFDELDEMNGLINNIGKDIIKVLIIVSDSKIKEKNEIIGIINKILNRIDELQYKVNKQNEIFEARLIEFDKK